MFHQRNMWSPRVLASSPCLTVQIYFGKPEDEATRLLTLLLCRFWPLSESYLHFPVDLPTHKWEEIHPRNRRSSWSGSVPYNMSFNLWTLLGVSSMAALCIYSPYLPSFVFHIARHVSPHCTNRNAHSDAETGGSGEHCKRRVRCMECSACLRKQDCGKCDHCKWVPGVIGVGLVGG